MSEQWSDNVVFQGKASRGMFSGHLPRRLFQVYTAKAERKPGAKDPNKTVYHITHAVQAAWKPDEASEGTRVVPDESMKDQAFINTITKPDGRGNPEHEGWNEQDIKDSFVAHGTFTPEQVGQMSGQMAIQSDYWVGRYAFLIYDPPPEHLKGEYPKINYLSQEDAYAIINGQARPVWPWDQSMKNKPGASGTAPVGAPAGAPVSAVGQFTAGRPAGAPPGVAAPPAVGLATGGGMAPPQGGPPVPQYQAPAVPAQQQGYPQGHAPVQQAPAQPQTGFAPAPPAGAQPPNGAGQPMAPAAAPPQGNPPPQNWSGPRQ